MSDRGGGASDRLVVDVTGVHVAVPRADHVRSMLDGLCVSEPARVDAVADLDGAAGADVEAVLAVVARAAIEQSADLLFHAGSVVRDGRAVLFPGASGAGKSTMTAACLGAGFGYMTDEMVAVDLDSGLARGWGRPLMLTPWSVAALGMADPVLSDSARSGPAKQLVEPSRLGAPTVREPVPVGHIVLVRHGADVTRLVPMDGADLLAELLACSFNHYRFGARAWEATARLAQAAAGWRLDTADLDEAAAAIAGLPTSGLGGMAS